MLRYSVVFIVLVFVGFASQARHNSDHPLSPEDWEEIMENVVLLEDSGLLPTLLPVIMGNRDALQLTDDQVNAFRSWRKQNYINVVNIMNEILQRKVSFRVEALSPNTPASRLIELQSDIQELQRQLLKVKLSCRKLVMTTFTDEQWDNFAFIISDNPRLASLMSQVNTNGSKKMH